MPTLKQICFTSAFIFALLSPAIAQQSSTLTQNSSLTITAAAAADRVRITAPSSVVQMHVEVYAASGEKLFDQEIRGGNVFDWHLQDGQAQRLAPGNYVCVVTAKSISGKLTQKIGAVSVEEKSASVQPAELPQLSAAQAQTIGPMEENSSWTIPGNGEPQTPTVIAHDGTDGQMMRGRGALTFRIGDFFSGIDQEQMRLTEDGRLGVGTNNPQAKLDVAGTIRAQRFLVAKPNGPSGDRKAQATDTADSVQPLASGTGTQDRIAKWIDNAGTLGDSGITEIGGNVGIGTTTPGSKLVVSSNSATLPPASGVARFADADGVQTAVFADAFDTNPIFNVRRANGTAASPSAVQANQLLGVIGAAGFGTSAYSGTRARVAFLASENWTNSANGTFITFNTTANGAATGGGTERLRIDNAGNVGIGTTTPADVLDIQKDGSAAFLTTSFGGSTFLFGRSAGGTRAAPTATPSLRSLMFLGGRGYNGSNFTASRAIVDLRTSEAWTGTANGARIEFSTTENGTTSTIERMRIENDGNVGIGTTAPLRHLHLLGSSDQEIGIQSSDVGGRQWTLQSSRGSTNGRFEIIDRTANANRFTILSDGNVGIGTTAPATRLDVAANSGHILLGDAGCNAGFTGLGFGSSLSSCLNYSLLGNGSDTIIGRPTGGTISFREANLAQMSILSGGEVGIGTAAPVTALHVARNTQDFTFPPLPHNHVATIENTSPSSSDEVNVLALTTGLTGTDNHLINYVTFFRAGATNSALPVGAIEGNGFGGVSYNSGGADYAELLPRFNPAEQIQPGEIVGLFDGRVTKQTRGATRVMAVSTGPVVLGNDPGKNARGGYEKVAFIGQVIARVRGTVQAGDFIVASGLDDGTGVAVSPECITSEQFKQVVGQAWETSANPAVKSVRTAVGLIQRDPTVSRLVEYSLDQTARINAMEARLTAFEARMQTRTTARNLTASRGRKVSNSHAVLHADINGARRLRLGSVLKKLPSS